MPRTHLETSPTTAARIFFFCALGARAQDEGGKWEVGLQFPALSATDGAAGISSVAPRINPPCPVVTTTSGGRQTEHGVVVGVPVPSETTHNFQGGVGFGFRF